MPMSGTHADPGAMAENETEQVQEAEVEETKSRGTVSLVVVTILTVGVGAMVGMKTVGPRLGAALAERAVTAAEKKSESEGDLQLHIVDNLVVNPAGSGGARFLLTSIALQAEDPAQVELLTARDVEIRDAFVMVLSAKSVDQLTDVSLRRQLNEELRRAAADVVGPGVVRRIFIPQFVIQ